VVRRGVLTVIANVTSAGVWAEATQKARELVGRMTLEEKVGGLSSLLRGVVGLVGLTK
jgi:hypothetical protein